MIIEEALQTYLLAYPGLSALVGDRITPPPLSQDCKFPAVTFFKTSGERGHPGDGPSGDAFPDFQITCWADKYTQAKTVANLVRFALDGFEGDMSGVPVYGVELFNEVDMYDEQAKKHGVALFFTVRHQEEVP